MREDPRIEDMGALDTMPGMDNVVALPNLMSGRLADLLAAAGGPAQEHELRGELSARTAYRAAADSWPSHKRHLRRTPAVVAVTTMATMLVATTGLAAASVLPGPAGRAVDGILGSVGVNIGAPATPPAPPAAGTSGSAPSASSASALGRAGITHVGCSVGGTDAGGSATGQVQTASCLITAPRAQSGAGSSSVGSTPAHAATTPARPVGAHRGGGSSTGQGSSTPPTTLPGGGTTRGGNIGGGTCKGGSGGGGTSGTGGTDPSGSGSGSTTTTTTTDPSGTGTSTCGHHGGHHGAGGGTGTTTTTTTATATS
jgi:hypothetical protein